MKRMSSVLFVVLSLCFVSSAFAQYNQTGSSRSTDEYTSPNPPQGAVSYGDLNSDRNFSRAAPSDVEGKVNVSITYQTGTFGTNVRTHNVYIPFTLIRYFNKWAIAGTLPYIYQKNDQRIAAIAGRPQYVRNTRGSVHDDSGPGDILGKLGYQALDETANLMNLWAIGQIKFPTADDETGLGTGKFDETIGVEGSKSFSESWKVFSDLYFTFMGDPDGLNLNNQLTIDLGVRYKMSAFTTLSLAYEDRSNLRNGRPNPRDFVFGVRRKASDETASLFGSLSLGVSEGSPDIGLTAGVSASF
jgi:hypothetical protein